MCVCAALSCSWIIEPGCQEAQAGEQNTLPRTEANRSEPKLSGPPGTRQSSSGECGGGRTGPVGVAHRQRGGIDASVRLGSEEAALLGSVLPFYRLLRSLLADAAFTDGRPRVFARAALPHDKPAGQSRAGAGPAGVWVQGCNRRGLPGKNQNPGGADERDLFIDAPAAVSERISMTLISVEPPPPPERCCSGREQTRLCNLCGSASSFPDWCQQPQTGPKGWSQSNQEETKHLRLRGKVPRTGSDQ